MAKVSRTDTNVSMNVDESALEEEGTYEEDGDTTEEDSPLLQRRKPFSFDTRFLKKTPGPFQVHPELMNLIYFESFRTNSLQESYACERVLNICEAPFLKMVVSNESLGQWIAWNHGSIR
jgi:hypothetical protein